MQGNAEQGDLGYSGLEQAPIMVLCTWSDGSQKNLQAAGELCFQETLCVCMSVCVC